MRVLITGAAGMIGAKLTAALVAQGAIGGRAVTAIDLVDVVARPDAETAAASTWPRSCRRHP
ncbi:MAG: hypothetical protein AAFN30_03910 [Actinomycetota bacterium]